jgi:choline dehydrogenase
MGIFSTPFLLAVTALFLPSTATASVGECDFVIVGGGTSGLVLANRLSAIPGVTVGVIEPGGDVRGNPNVTKPTSWLKNMGTGIDWQYTTSPQSAPAPPQQNGSGSVAGGGRVLTYHAGKAVGGTSTINGTTTRNTPTNTCVC